MSLKIYYKQILVISVIGNKFWNFFSNEYNEKSMKYQDEHNDQHISDLELKNLPKFNKERVRKNRVCKFFLKN